MPNSTNLAYPIGKSTAHPNPDAATLKEWIEAIRNFPQQLKECLSGVEDNQLNWPYRPGGWSIREVVHHCVDSHLNGFMRFKLALTEDKPEIIAYKQGPWATLADGQEADIRNSLFLLESLHHRWLVLIDSLSADDRQRQFYHPEHQKLFSLNEAIGMYAWHGAHHLAHVKQALASEGKYLS